MIEEGRGKNERDSEVCFDLEFIKNIKVGTRERKIIKCDLTSLAIDMGDLNWQRR